VPLQSTPRYGKKMQALLMRHGLLGAVMIESAGNQRVGNHHRCEVRA